jgi:hypothetical protein
MPIGNSSFFPQEGLPGDKEISDKRASKEKKRREKPDYTVYTVYC